MAGEFELNFADERKWIAKQVARKKRKWKSYKLNRVKQNQWNKEGKRGSN